MQIPQNFSDFLFWVKERTELFWSIDPASSTNDFVCEDWIFGAKWIGLTETEINAIEKKYAIRFMPEHRAFLKILHTIDRKQKAVAIETFKEEVEVLVREQPFFYNWLQDETAINEKLNWPYNTILEDIVGSNQVWLESWGVKPQSDDEKIEFFADWYGKAPQLLPVTGHRFLVSEPDLQVRPVLSILGADIIVYGWSFRSYLLNELQNHLGILKNVYDNEGNYLDTDFIDNEVKEIFSADRVFDESKDIPYWKEMIVR